MNKYIIVKKWSTILKVIEYCKATRYCSHDFETTGVEYYDPNHYPTTLAISFQPGSSYVIPLGHFESPFKHNYPKILKLLGKELFENEDVIKVGQNIKFENKWLLRYGVTYKGRVFDTMLAKHLLDEERPHGLDYMVTNFLPEYDGYWDEVDVMVKKYGGWDKVPLKPLAKYNALDSDLTLRLMIRFEEKLIKGGFYKLFRNLFMPLSNLIAEGEFKGIPVDMAYLDNLIITYEKKIGEMRAKMLSHKVLSRYTKAKKKEIIEDMIEQAEYEIKKLKKSGASERVIQGRMNKVSQYYSGQFLTNKDKKRVAGLNLASPVQMVDLLYTHPKGFKFPIIEYTVDQFKRPTDKPSTAEPTLMKLASHDKTGFLKELLELRGTEKLYGTYMVGIKKLVDSNNLIHANFKIHGTVTGRMSCVEPNLQNIPRGTTSSDIKNMFIAPPGWGWVEVDYSQAELRVVAHMAQDKAMLEIFQKNFNIHVATACKLNGGLHLYDKVKSILANPEHPENIKWEKEKKKGKVLNFSVLYMQSDKQTAEQMGVKLEEAKAFKKEWFKQFSAIQGYIEGQFDKAYEHGYVKTMFGMKRRLPNIYATQQGVKFEAHRQAVNAPIQGTASQFTLLSMVLADEKIKSGEIPYGRWMYNVHDSIGYLVEIPNIHKFVREIVKICANPETKKYFGFEMKDVTMKVSPEVGSKWGDVQDYDAWKDYGKLLITNK